MTRLSVKALRHYDQIGLLEPTHIDESSGYRYYHLGQANRAEAIKILRSVEMPLDEIKAVLEADNAELIRKQLEAHKERLAEKLANQERMLAYLETLIEREEGLMPYEISVNNVDSQTVAAIKKHTELANISNDIAAGFGSLVHAMGGAGVEAAGPPLIVYHDVIDEQTPGDIEICIPVAAELASEDGVYSRELEAATVATTMHKGPYPEISAAYHALTVWISEHGHAIAGPPREVYLNDPTIAAPEDLLTRVDWPIEADQS